MNQGGGYALGARPKYAQNMRKHAQKYAQNTHNRKNGVGSATPYLIITHGLLQQNMMIFLIRKKCCMKKKKELAQSFVLSGAALAVGSLFGLHRKAEEVGAKPLRPGHLYNARKTTGPPPPRLTTTSVAIRPGVGPKSVVRPGFGR